LTPVDYGPARDADEVRAHGRNMSWSFRAAEDDLQRAFERYGTDKLRVLRENGETIAGLSLLPLGQWWGGRRLAMGGISLVGVAPEHRGRGAATRLMRAVVREMKEGGYPVSVLYPAKQTLYRRAGWELAGSRWEIAWGAGDPADASRDGTIREIRAEDLESVDAAYRRWARDRDGALDRPDFMWLRIREPWKHVARGFLVEGTAGPEGWVWLYETEGSGHGYDLHLVECAALTRAAGRRLLAFVGDHASLGQTVRWWGDPRDPMVSLFREQRYKARVFFQWMLRVVDAKAAIEGRGYPPGVTASIHLEIDDELVPENSGRVVVDVTGGRAEVRAGGDGKVRVGARGLAALWSGHLPASRAAVAGLAEGDRTDLAAADAVFGSAPASMSDMF